MVETARLVAKIETKGAKRSSDELKKFGKAANDAERSTDKLTTSGKKFASASRSLISSFKSVKGGLVGLAASLAAAAVSMAFLKDETKILADIAGASVQEFQAMSVAFGTLGVSAEKTSDILKDVNDKVGDFVLTGGGEFKDVFENILQPIGFTIDKLKELSSREVLIAVATGLDKMNASAQESTFILEALANDATKLLPALKDNGKAIDDITESLRSKGLLVTPEETIALQNANIELREMAGIISATFLQSQI